MKYKTIERIPALMINILSFNIESVVGTASTLTMGLLLKVIFTAAALGTVLTFFYLFANRKCGFSKGLAVSLTILTTVIAVIILLVSDNFARAFSLAGAFTIIRFRSNPGRTKDMVYIFATLAIGLACGLGYLLAAAVITAILILLIVLFSFLMSLLTSTPVMMLRITVPEDLNYVGVFDDIFKEYTTDVQTEKVKSSNFGTMFDLYYKVKFKKDIDQKAFFDALRTRNGNLNISLQNYVSEEEF